MFVWTFEGVVQAIIMGIIFIPLIILGILMGVLILFEKIASIFNKGD